MKIYLDDERATPEGWHRCYSPAEVISLLQTGGVSELSLDHDLGIDPETGYDVLLWIEEQVATTDYVPPEQIRVHSANSSARDKMKAAIRNIIRLVERRDQRTAGDSEDT